MGDRGMWRRGGIEIVSIKMYWCDHGMVGCLAKCGHCDNYTAIPEGDGMLQGTAVGGPES
eukprot:4542861-Pyramimonas_sp.AAC.1